MPHTPKPPSSGPRYVGPDSLDPGAEADFQAAFHAVQDEGGPVKGVTDVFRKAMVAGLGAVFMTEEGLRSMVKDLKLPKDVVGYIVGQAERSKDEFFRVIGDELRRFFENPALRRELTKVLSDMTIEVKAEIRLRPDGKSPEVKIGSTTARRGKKKRS